MLIFLESGNLTLLEPSGPVQACTGTTVVLGIVPSHIDVSVLVLLGMWYSLRMVPWCQNMYEFLKPYAQFLILLFAFVGECNWLQVYVCYVCIHSFIFCLLFFSSKANWGYRASINFFLFHEELHGVSFLCHVLYHSFPRLSMLCMHKTICPDPVVMLNMCEICCWN